MESSITSLNPSSKQPLKSIPCTPLEAIPKMVEEARKAQTAWALVSPRKRAALISNAKEYIIDHLDEIADLIHTENGKPITEAVVHDILPVLETITHYGKRTPKLLKDRSLWLRFLFYRKSYYNYWPVGVIGVISPWNFPFSIPFGEVVLALLAGNAVILKPSEVTPLIGLKIAEILEHAGLPKNIFQVIIGEGKQGDALVRSGLNKIFFTGSVATGKKVMAAASATLTPVILELGGKDPMVVLPDANLDFATSAALWGSFANLGQICASTERIIVHESIHDEFVSLLAKKAKLLKNKPGPDGFKDLGSITLNSQKEIYKTQLKEITTSTGQIILGGNFSQDETFLEPTIVTNPQGSNSDSCPIEKLKIYSEETFGPIVAITKYRTVQQAIEKANDTEYGLLASVIGKDTNLCEQVARQIQAGTVLINEVLYSHALSETPWGGVKNSGFGRVHSDEGFYEFVHKRHIQKERAPFFVFKSLWWFPYSEHQLSTFKLFISFMYRRSLMRRLINLPNLLVELVQLIKTEKRL